MGIGLGLRRDRFYRKETSMTAQWLNLGLRYSVEGRGLQLFFINLPDVQMEPGSYLDLTVVWNEADNMGKPSVRLETGAVFRAKKLRLLRQYAGSWGIRGDSECKKTARRRSLFWYLFGCLLRENHSRRLCNITCDQAIHVDSA